ncbi:XRE family transcriptional regulator [Candidatus Bipolaricaulota bacterium]|nr:XRE family transcriptional regulator [Candidatus Bipolaricaulota bacterium]
MTKEQVEEKFNGKQAKTAPKQPCEVALWHVLPCIRACLARELVEKDLTQQRVADILGITQAAVSQYIGKKRGNFRTKDNTAYKMIEELAEDLEKDAVNDLSKRICQICSQVQQSPQLLSLCGVPDSEADRINIC